MAKKITKLTAEQEAMIPVVRDEFLKIGLSTEPADFDAAEEAVRDAYKVAGIEPPKIFVRLASPHEGAIAAAILKGTKLGAQVWAQVRAQVGDQVWAQVGDQVWAQVGAQVGDQVWDQVRDQVWAQVVDQVRDQVWAQVVDQVRAQVWAQVVAQVRAQVGDQVRDQVWAQVRAQVKDQVGAQVGDQVKDQVVAQVWDQVWAQVGDQVRAQVWDQVWDQVVDQVRAQVRAQVKDQVGAQVGDQVKDQVGDQVGDQVVDQVVDQVGDQVGDQVWDAFYSQHEAGFLSFYAFFANAVGLDCAQRLEPLARIARNCGWVWFFSGVVVLTDRPRTLKRDENNRLHCEDGPALEYRDGFSIYAWHGTRLPAEWVENRKTIDPAAILKAENVEQRAAGAAMIGWPRMVSALKRKIIDGDPDSDMGALIELTLPGLSEPGRFLQASCPRNGTIVEGVPRISDVDGLPIDTAIAAQAWRIGDPQSEYIHPSIRT